MKLIRELFSIIASDPFDRAHTVKLRGEWEGHRRAKRGDRRLIYLPPEEGVVYVVYIRGRSEKTYKKWGRGRSPIRRSRECPATSRCGS